MENNIKLITFKNYWTQINTKTKIQKHLPGAILSELGLGNYSFKENRGADKHKCTKTLHFCWFTVGLYFDV